MKMTYEEFLMWIAYLDDKAKKERIEMNKAKNQSNIRRR
jgi:hypothetical protein|tara:strand:- start:342 stop:458 length:117 start_codon:yes stop_codon:yes gene_type:complete